MVSAIALPQGGDSTKIVGAWSGSPHVGVIDERFASSLESVTQQDDAKAVPHLLKGLLPKGSTPIDTEMKAFVEKASDVTAGKTEAVLSTSQRTSVEGVNAKVVATSVAGCGVSPGAQEAPASISAKTLNGEEPSCQEIEQTGPGERYLVSSDEDAASDYVMKNAAPAIANQRHGSELKTQQNELLDNAGCASMGKAAGVKHSGRPLAVAAKETKKTVPNGSSSSVNIASINGINVTASSMIVVGPIDESPTLVRQVQENDSSAPKVAMITIRQPTAALGVHANGGEPAIGSATTSDAEVVDGKIRVEDATRGVDHEAVAAPAESTTTKTSEIVVPAPLAADPKITAMTAVGVVKSHDTESAVNLTGQGMSTAGGGYEGPGSQDGHGVIGATPTSLDVGVANGTHGWLKIRAEMTGGTVMATLSASTHSGQEMLHRELPSLNRFLAQEQVSVKSVVVNNTVAVPSFAGMSNNNASREGPDGHDRNGVPQGDDSQERNRGSGATSRLNHAAQVGGNEGRNISEAPNFSNETTYSGGGGWLSVRA